MKTDTFGHPLPLAALAALGLACSSKDNVTMPTVAVSARNQLTPQVATTVSLPPPRALATTTAASPMPDGNSPVLSIAVPLSSECTLTPQGISNDPLHTAVLNAQSMTRLYFFPPSGDWGTKLAVTCDTGSAKVALALDLNDASTVQRTSVGALAPRRVGVRPALAGTPSTVSAATLLTNGYPPRPDPVNAPDLYAAWLHAVTQPMSLYAGTPIAAIGHWASGGNPSGINNDAYWSAFVQNASGFTNDGYNSALPGTLYGTYLVEMYLPGNYQGNTPGGCPANTACETSLWGGLGGWSEYLPGGYGPFQTEAILQNGFSVSAGSNNNPNPGTWMFAEFYPGNPWYIAPPASGANGPTQVGDVVLAVGQESSTSACADANINGTYGCFGWEDLTAGWTVSPFPIQIPTGALWAPETAEFVAEVPGSCPPFQTCMQHTTLQNTYYWFDVMYGAAWDMYGSPHFDPGAASGTDPYVWALQGQPHASYSYWSNFSNPAASAVDPMYFVWNSFNANN